MHEATQITITRAEGPTALCRVPRTFDGPDCWADARIWLFSQSTTFPAEGGYDKHDFSVTFADGYVYEGRLDCKHPTCSEPDLNVAAHVRGFLRFYASERCPPHMTRERYEEFLARQPEAVAECRDLLARYAIPER
jgi:hypothetical protein